MQELRDEKGGDEKGANDDDDDDTQKAPRQRWPLWASDEPSPPARNPSEGAVLEETSSAFDDAKREIRSLLLEERRRVRRRRARRELGDAATDDEAPLPEEDAAFKDADASARDLSRLVEVAKARERFAPARDPTRRGGAAGLRGNRPRGPGPASWIIPRARSVRTRISPKYSTGCRGTRPHHAEA